MHPLRRIVRWVLLLSFFCISASLLSASERLPIRCESPDGRVTIEFLWGPRSDQERGSVHFASLTAKPGATIPAHQHEHSTEVVLILDGEGLMTLADRSMKVQPGERVVIPSGTDHSLVVQGTRPLRAIQIYDPPGPEVRFLQWSCKNLPESSRSQNSLP